MPGRNAKKAWPGLGNLQRRKSIKVITSKKEMAAHADLVRSQGKTLVFVPTMGFLHEGHISLMEIGLAHGNHLVVSIFVNPAQFGPTEDLDAYPRDMERDLALCKKAGAAAVYTPDASSMYGPGFETRVIQESLPNHLCGLSRPRLFSGVTTVVTKLFNTVKPHVAVFGEKDFQQLAVLKRMTLDLDFDIKIVSGPTVREQDGLAKSSRNSYLSATQRKNATALYQCLEETGKKVAKGQLDTQGLLQEAKEKIAAVPEAAIDYINIVDPNSLVDVARVEKPALMAMAVFVGKTRLIDNMMLYPPG